MNRKQKIFYAGIAVALSSAAIGVLALSDIPGWAVRMPAIITFTVFKYRTWIMGLGIGGFVLSLLVGWRLKYLKKYRFAVYTVLFAALFVAGYVNPSYLMFRSQHHSARYVPVRVALNHIREAEPATVIEVDGEARAYPHKWLAQPHVTGDEIGGQEVAVTYCPLSNLGQAFANQVDGNPLNLLVLKRINNNLVMFDANTLEPIQQIYGFFRNTRKQLDQVPSTVMTLESFQQLYPEGKVFFNPAMNAWDTFTRWLQTQPFYANGGPNGSRTSRAGFASSSGKIQPREKIYGVRVNGDCLAYTRGYLKRHNNVVVDEVGGVTVTVKYFPEHRFVDIYYGDVPEVDPHGFDSRGVKQTRVPHYNQVFWEIWSHFFPKTGARV
jgi:hypothetical protein